MSFAIGSGSLTSVIAQWASDHAASMGDELRGLMKQADHRAQLLKELNEVKSAIARGCVEPLKLEEAQRLLGAFLQQHPEYEATLTKVLEDVAKEFRDYAYNGKVSDTNSQNLLAGYIGPNGKWGIALDGAIDDLRNQDRMGMIAIQDLVDKLKQAEMLGSNLIRSINDAAESVIGNIA